MCIAHGCNLTLAVDSGFDASASRSFFHLLSEIALHMLI